VIIPAKSLRSCSSRIVNIFIEVATLVGLSLSFSKCGTDRIYRNEKLSTSVNRA
jgi:hypothetical protein